jgi:hypothetical protein
MEELNALSTELGLKDYSKKGCIFIYINNGNFLIRKFLLVQQRHLILGNIISNKLLSNLPR